jgi:hypothetical protein
MIMKTLLSAALVAVSLIGGLAHADVLYEHGNEQPSTRAFNERDTGGVTRAEVKAELAQAIASGELNDIHELPAGPFFPQRSTAPSALAAADLGPTGQGALNN